MLYVQGNYCRSTHSRAKGRRSFCLVTSIFAYNYRMSREPDFIEDIEKSLKEGDLKLRCDRCGESNWTYLELDDSYQCQNCSNRQGRIRRATYASQEEPESETIQEPQRYQSSRSDSRILPRVIKSLVLGVILIFGALILIHGSTVGSISDAFRMTSNDVRVFIHCPHKPREIIRFIFRSEMESYLLPYGAFTSNKTVEELVCGEAR